MRFKGANFWDLISQFGVTITTHEQIDQHVRMLKKQGFTALRWRMDVERNGVFEAPYKIKDSYWDLYDYLLYALGREGIYSYFYICSHSIGSPSFKWNDRYAVKVKMSLGDPETWEDWRKFAKMQLEHYNPYTRKKWKDDPSIATVEYWNEFCLGMPHSGACEPSIRKFVQKKWEEYLERRYKTIENFNAENKRLGLVWVPAKKVPQKFSDVILTTGKQYEYYKNYKHPDFARFVVENVSEMQKFFRKVVRDEIGMKAPAFQNNCVKQMYWTFLSAMIGDCISINTYHSGATTFGVGARMKQISSITGGANYFCGSLAKHVDGMPLTVTEYNHCYYNIYPHEAGLVFPAYAALQDYSALMIFDCPVADQPKNLKLRRVGVNPVFGVNDFLTNFIYERGDVSPSKHKIDIVYDDDFLQKSPYSTGGMNWSQSKLGLMAGTYIALPDVKKVPELSHVKVKPADASFKYAPPSEIKTSTNASEIGESGGDFDWKPVMAELRQKGILPKDNRSDPEKGIFESDTGEIYLDCASRLIEVNTPKLCGAVVNPDTKNLKVGALEVRSSSARACVAAVALDNVELAKSKRIMLTLSTDVVYKSSKFSINRDQLFDFGKPPILLEVCKLSAAIDSNGAEFDVYPLKMSGERIESAKFTARAVNGKIPISVDTAKIPVVYFELVAK